MAEKWAGGIGNRGTKEQAQWYCKFRDIDGKWKVKHTHQPSKEEARKFLAEIKGRVARGLLGLPGKEETDRKFFTVLALCERFAAEASSPRIRDIEKYRTRQRCLVKNQVKPFAIASMRYADLRSHHIGTWRDQLRADGYGAETINHALHLLSISINWGMEHEIIPQGLSPMKRVERMPTERSEEHYSLDEVHRLLALPFLPPMVPTAFYTGARKGELFGLHWPDVHLDDPVPWLYIQFSYDGPTKTKKKRKVPIHPELLPILRAWRDECPQNDEALVFPVAMKASRWHATPSPALASPEGPDLVRGTQAAALVGLPAPTFHQRLRDDPKLGALRIGSGAQTRFKRSELLAWAVANVAPREKIRGWRMGDEGDMEGLPDLLRAAGCHVPLVEANNRDPSERAWHATRHTFITLATEAGVAGVAIEQVVGHTGRERSRMTMGYTHVGLPFLLNELCRLTLRPPPIALLDEPPRFALTSGSTLDISTI